MFRGALIGALLAVCAIPAVMLVAALMTPVGTLVTVGWGAIGLCAVGGAVIGGSIGVKDSASAQGPEKTVQSTGDASVSGSIARSRTPDIDVVPYKTEPLDVPTSGHWRERLANDLPGRKTLTR